MIQPCKIPIVFLLTVGSADLGNGIQAINGL